jgi:hypothetical protein
MSRSQRTAMSIARPLARSSELVVEEVDNELLVYDRKNNRAHCLGETAARVWRACDGNTDVGMLSAELDLSSEMIDEALEQLEASELLDQGLKVFNVDASDGNGITRRELAGRSAKIGTAAAIGAPLILSIAAPTAMAAVTPPPFICQLYTTQDCGTSSGCAAIKGCCCCCQGEGSCKVCSSVNFCNSGMQTCIGGGTGTHCSSVGSASATTRGCCGVDGSKQCGCAWGPGGGCCDQHTGLSCTPSATNTNCVPCCNGKILLTGSAIGCCSSTTGTGTCVTMNPS